MNTVELLPCPHCGGEAEIYLSGLEACAACKACDAKTVTKLEPKAEPADECWKRVVAAAAASWNRRALPAGAPDTPPDNSLGESKKSQQNSGPEVGARFRHKRTGGLYRFLHYGFIEADASPCVVYRAEDGGVVWVRPRGEFHDGRFEQVASPATAPSTAEGVTAFRPKTCPIDSRPCYSPSCNRSEHCSRE